MKLILLLLTVTLTGCAVPPKFVSHYFDSQDPCQSAGKKKDWVRPDWCWSGTSYLITKQPIAPGAARYTITR